MPCISMDVALFKVVLAGLGWALPALLTYISLHLVKEDYEEQC